MLNHKVRPSVSAGLTLAVLIILARPVSSAQANGCSGIQATPPPSVAQRTVDAPVVLEGTVTAIIGPDAGATMAVQVHQYLKGGGPSLVYIAGFHQMSTVAECADWAEVGSHAIFFAQRDAVSGKLHTSIIQPWPSTLPADSDSLREAIAAAGQSPATPLPETEVPPPTPTLTYPQAYVTSVAATATATAVRAQTNSSLSLIFAVTGVALGAAAILLIIGRVVSRNSKET